MMRTRGVILSSLVFLSAQFLCAQSMDITHWNLISSTEISSGEEKLSTVGFQEGSWYDAIVPTTVLNALVHQGIYPDPRIGLNNYEIPDVSDEFNEKMNLGRFSYLADGRNPWQDPYWYRTEIVVPSSFKGRRVWLNLDGINYRADVWINGNKVADHSDVVGMFRRFKFDVTDLVQIGEKNCFAIKIYQVDHPGTPTPGTQLKVFGPVRGHSYDLFKDETLKISGGWDCAPVVRDRNMGLYQKVWLQTTGEVVLENPFIETRLPKWTDKKNISQSPERLDEIGSQADLSIKVEVRNDSDREISGRLKAQISLVHEVEFPTYTKYMEGDLKPIEVGKRITLAPGEKRSIVFNSEEFRSLLVSNPYLWFPNGYGEQYLHHLHLSFEHGRKCSDVKDFDFGIREVYSDLKQIGADYGRRYFINGRRIFCKGGWIQPDILLEESKKRIYDEARLMAEANINLIGSEDMPSPSDTWMESFDKYGLMWWHVFYQCFRMMPGTETEHNPVDHDLAVECVEDMMLRYRNHPCLITWIGANEVLMDEHLYGMTKEKVQEIDPGRLYLPTTSHGWEVDLLTPYLKPDLPTGTTDDGAPDYNWVPAEYYFDKVREVYLQMFRNELGTPSMPVYNSLCKFIPAIETRTEVNSPIYPLDEVWAEHGAWDVSNYCYRSYDNAIRTLFGDPRTAKEYADRAQFLNADGYRAMFEAANHRMWDITSGVMIWKINSCWPDVCWQMYDWFLTPNASYYFAKRAMEPIHIQMNANDRKVSVINTRNVKLKRMKVKAEVINNDLSVAWSHEEETDIAADGYTELFQIPQEGRYAYNYFIRLSLEDQEGTVVSDNLYWDYSQHQDFFWFTYMEKPDLDQRVDVKTEEGEYVFSVELSNHSDRLSFFNRLVLRDGDGREINPVFWSDNYVTLFPGESRHVQARVSVEDAKGEIPLFGLYNQSILYN